MIFAAGCAAPPPRNDRESWSCERTPDGNDWTCNQLRKRYGVPVPGEATQKASPAGAAARQVAGDVETGTAIVMDDRSGAAVAVKTAEKTAETGSQPMRARDRDSAGINRWSASLPALSAGVVDVPPLSESKVADREPRKPPPEPEPVLARWEKGAAGAKAVSERRVGVHEQVPRSEKVLAPTTAPAAPAQRRSIPVVGSVSESCQPGVGDRRIYTVQIGAFKSDRAARAYIAQHNLGELPDLVVAREMRGLNEYTLITFGRFEGPKAAVEAWRGSGAPRDLKVWVRPVSAVPRAAPKVTPAAC